MNIELLSEAALKIKWLNFELYLVWGGGGHGTIQSKREHFFHSQVPTWIPFILPHSMVVLHISYLIIVLEIQLLNPHYVLGDKK